MLVAYLATYIGNVTTVKRSTTVTLTDRQTFPLLYPTNLFALIDRDIMSTKKLSKTRKRTKLPQQ